MSVLFVTACSLTKAAGGAGVFDGTATIASTAPREADRLMARRDQVRELVKSGEAVWQEVPLRDLDYNRRLAKGFEFGGRKNADYLPAVERYQGRFFQALGDAGRARCRSKDNMLVISGLYGLLRTSEPIQLYSCPLFDEVAAIWARDGLLTDILRRHIARNHILRVFDLTAMSAYRRLIDWDRLAADGADVLHCFDSMAAGESALTSFGRLCRRLVLLTDDELIALEPERPSEVLETCCLQRSMEPPRGYPAEAWSADKAAKVLGGGYETPGGDGSDAGSWRFTVSSRFPGQAKSDFENVVEAMMKICRAPMTPHGDTVKRLSGYGDRLWRYRLGDCRLVYEPERARRVVRFLRFGPRGDVYKGL